MISGTIGTVPFEAMIRIVSDYQFEVLFDYSLRYSVLRSTNFLSRASAEKGLREFLSVLGAVIVVDNLPELAVPGKA